MNPNTDNRSHEQPIVYTIHPGAVPIHGNVNYAYQSNHPQAPPPKYEDVISGRHTEPQSSLPPYGSNGSNQPEVILVAPAYKYSRTQRTIALIFMTLFVCASTSILIRVLVSR